MQDNMGSTHPHYALIEYARDMHQYTLELWMELSKKIDAEGSRSVPDTDASATTNPGDEHAPRGGASSADSTEAESPQDE